MAKAKKAAPASAKDAKPGDGAKVTTVKHDNGTITHTWIDKKTGKPSMVFYRQINAKYKLIADASNPGAVRMVPLKEKPEPDQ